MPVELTLTVRFDEEPDIDELRQRIEDEWGAWLMEWNIEEV